MLLKTFPGPIFLFSHAKRQEVAAPAECRNRAAGRVVDTKGSIPYFVRQLKSAGGRGLRRRLQVEDGRNRPLDEPGHERGGA